MNILCCEYEPNKYKLVIIDGLGGTNLIKCFVMFLSKYYLKRRLKKAIKGMIIQLEDLGINVTMEDLYEK